jgi:hypothetical protein
VALLESSDLVVVVVIREGVSQRFWRKLEWRVERKLGFRIASKFLLVLLLVMN